MLGCDSKSTCHAVAQHATALLQKWSPAACWQQNAQDTSHPYDHSIRDMHAKKTHPGMPHA
jgi:hypothetical protein